MKEFHKSLSSLEKAINIFESQDILNVYCEIAVLTGELSKSVYTKNSGSNQQIIGATAPHAAIQEFGGANVAPRNNIRRPLAENKARIANKIQLAINNNLKGL